MIALSITVSAVWLWSRRNRYFCLRDQITGQPREGIVYLPLRQVQHPKLRAEIKIFNRLHVVMPQVHGAPVVYWEQMQALLHDPKTRPGADPYVKLFYGYACAVILAKHPAPTIARQLRKNLLLLLAPPVKIVKRIRPVWSPKFYDLHPTPLFKVWGEQYFDPTVAEFVTTEPVRLTVYGSYLKYQNANLLVKRFANFYELRAKTEQTFTLHLAADKTDYTCTIARGVVTCKHLVTGEVHTYTVRGAQFRLATTLAQPVDALQLIITFVGALTISIDHGVRRLLSDAELLSNRQVEHIAATAYQAKYLQGERLRQRYLAAERVVPSLRCLTKVIILQTPEDFFQVWDELALYRRTARIFKGFNLVFLYSGANPLMADLVSSMIDTAQVKACQADQLLLFFLDRTTLDPDALYFLVRLTKPPRYEKLAPTIYPERVSRTYPYVKTITFRNQHAEPLRFTAQIPLKFNSPAVVTASGSTLTVVGLFTGRTTVYQLPTSLHIPQEWLTTHVNLPVKINLAGFQQQQITITRTESNNSGREYRKKLVAALEEIQVTTGDRALDALFRKPVCDTNHPALLNLVKAAYQNVDRKLLIAALEDKHELPADVWQFLLVKLVGIRWARGKVYLAPCVNLMGEFQISFRCYGQQYTFNTRKGLPITTKCVTIQHG